ncbi:MAG: homoserine dehydrogenase [Myxococcales bacterium]|nr:homoserine dehydrogenase [Myxococcales bacterium]
MEQLTLGLLGCGTVGTGVLKMLKDNASEIQARLGVPVRVKRIAVRDIDRPRDPVVDPALLTSDADEVVADPEIDILVELIGGIEPAKTLILKALEQGKPVVTANKALLATHGPELFSFAEEQSADIHFEASVCGGIPIVRTLRESLASDHIRTLHGIINGTSNYILSKMSDEKLAYADALRQAQELGYAEADPTMDVDGTDAAQKLSILVGLGFGVRIDYTRIHRVALAHIDPLDVEYAADFGYKIKPLAIARMHGDDLEARVQPVMVPRTSPLGSVSGAFNAVLLNTYALRPLLLYGQGAGMLPTAVSVASDVIEVGRNLSRQSSGRLPHLAYTDPDARNHRLLGSDDWASPFFLRFSVVDRPGVLATIAGVLGEKKISIYQMVQKNPGGGRPVQVVIFTHHANFRHVRDSLQFLDGLEITQQTTQSIPIEESL